MLLFMERDKFDDIVFLRLDKKTDVIVLHIILDGNYHYARNDLLDVKLDFMILNRGIITRRNLFAILFISDFFLTSCKKMSYSCVHIGQ